VSTEAITYSPEQVDIALEYLNDAEKAKLKELLERRRVNDLVARCSKRVVSHTEGPMFFLRSCTMTENYQWQAQGLEPKAPFPYWPYPPELLSGIPPERMDWDYLDWLMHFFLNDEEIYVPKSRELLTTWLAVGYVFWDCQFFQPTGWIGQSEDDEKAMGLIKYANILYDNQDPGLKARFPLKRGESGTQHKIEWAEGGWFRAVASGERKLASDHPKGYLNDESAHQPAWETTKDIAKPAVRQSIHISSAAPSRFFDLCDQSNAV
jgi:hypothetical protein